MNMVLPKPLRSLAEQPVYITSPCGPRSRAAHWRSLRASGVAIASSWIDEPAQAPHPAQYWSRVEQEISQSIGTILCFEDSSVYRREPSLEAMLTLGMGKPVKILVYGLLREVDLSRALGSWVYHRNVSVHAEFQDALQELRRAFSAAPRAPEPGPVYF